MFLLQFRLHLQDLDLVARYILHSLYVHKSHHLLFLLEVCLLQYFGLFLHRLLFQPKIHAIIIAYNPILCIIVWFNRRFLIYLGLIVYRKLSLSISLTNWYSIVHVWFWFFLSLIIVIRWLYFIQIVIKNLFLWWRLILNFCFSASNCHIFDVISFICSTKMCLFSIIKIIFLLIIYI